MNGAIMKLLLLLLSLFFSFTAQAMMLRVDPKKEMPKSYSVAQILEKIKRTNSLEQNLQMLRSGANILCAQDELAQAIKANQMYSKDIDVASETKLVEEIVAAVGSNTVQPIGDLKKAQFLKNVSHDAPDISPEAMAFVLNTSNAFFNQNECILDWETILDASLSEDPYLSSYALFVLTQKHTLDAKRKSLENINHLQLLTQKIMNQSVISSPHDLIEHVKPLTTFVAVFGKFKAKVRDYIIDLAKQNPQLDIRAIQEICESGKSIADAAAIITGKVLPEYTRANLEFAKEKNQIDDEFIKMYMPIRISCCDTYKSFRSLLNKYTQDNSTMAANYLAKLYDPQCQFPRELPTSIEPQPLPQSLKIQSTASASVIKEEKTPESKSIKAKKNKAKKASKALAIVQSSAALASNAPQAPAPATTSTPAKTKVAKKIAQNFIKEIQDSLNTMTIHLYCSFKQKKEIPTFARHKRLLEWFEDGKATLAKQGYLDPENPKHRYKDTAIAYHAFSLDVDPVAQKYGTQYEEVDKNGNRTLFIAIPGHIVRHGQITFGIFGFAIDPITKLCYHRCFEERTNKQLLNEYLNAQEWKVTLDQIAQS